MGSWQESQVNHKAKCRNLASRATTSLTHENKLCKMKFAETAQSYDSLAIRVILLNYYTGNANLYPQALQLKI